jgi:hypothetical protein
MYADVGKSLSVIARRGLEAGALHVGMKTGLDHREVGT